MKFLQQSTVSERVTAALSTLFAIAILGVAVTAQQRETPQSVERAASHLAQLEAGLIEQLDIAYRHDTRVLEAKIAEFNGVLKAWQAAAPSEERDAKLAGWIRDAMHRSMPGRNQPLPATPDFAATVASATPRTDEADAFSEPTVEQTAASGDRPAPTERAPQEWPASDIANLEDFVPRKVDASAPVPDLAPTPVDWNRNPFAESDAEVDPQLDNQTAIEIVASGEISEAATSEAMSSERVSSESASIETVTIERAPTEETVVVGSPEVPSLTGDREEAPFAVETPAQTRNAFAAPTSESELNPATVPEALQVRTEIEINVRELTARIAGYHEGLREVEAAIVNRDKDSAKGLEGIVETLEELTVESDFVTLYYDLLTDEQRRFVRAPRSIEPTIARVQQRLEQAASPEQGDFLRPFDPSERAKLEQLGARLHLLAMGRK